MSTPLTSTPRTGTPFQASVHPGTCVMVHTLVALRPGADRPIGASVLHERVFDLCHRTGRRVFVGEIAGLLGTSPALVSVAVSDLVRDDRLVLHHPRHSQREKYGHAHVERLLSHLRDHPPVHADTVKLVVVGEPGHGVSTFLSHLGTAPIDAAPTFHDGPGRTLECALGTIDVDLYLAVLGVHGAAHLQAQWPDVMREADGVIVLVRSDRLSRAQETAWMLRSHAQTPFLVAVNLVDEGADPTADEVRSTLDLEAEAPVVMVDAREGMSVTTAIADLCTWVLKQEVGR